MGRTTRKDNRDLPHPKPVEKVQLSQKHVGLRIALVVIFLAIGVSALVYGFLGLIGGGDGGWQEITASNSGEEHCGGEFIFRYDVGGSGLAVRTEYRQLTDLYTKLMIRAYQIFHSQSQFEGVTNLYVINRHPGEVLTVDPALYEAFRLLQENGRRELYMGPLYMQYDNLFFCQSEEQTMEFDPFVNAEAAQYCQELASYAAGPADIHLALLGDNQVRLELSEEYARYAREEGIVDFLDFGWMRNAFVIDYVADILDVQGFTRGTLSSYDGFTRNLDQRENVYAYNLFDRRGQVVYGAGTLRYRGPVSMVFLRDYPMNQLDIMHYYEKSNGEIRFPYLDIASGLCNASLHNLVGYSHERSCAEVMVSLLPVYIADHFDAGALRQLAEEEIYGIYCQDKVIYHTEEAAEIGEIQEEYGLAADGE